MNGPLLLLSSLLHNLRLQTGLKTQVSSVSAQQFSAEAWGAQPAAAQATEWVGTTTECLKLFFHKLFIRMQIRLMEINSFLKHNKTKKQFQGLDPIPENYDLIALKW